MKTMTYEEFEKEVARLNAELDGKASVKDWAKGFWERDLRETLKIVKDWEKGANHFGPNTNWGVPLARRLLQLRWGHILNSKMYKLLNEHD